MTQRREYNQSAPLDHKEQYSHNLIVGTLLIGFQLLESPYQQAKGELAMIIQKNENMINFFQCENKGR